MRIFSMKTVFTYACVKWFYSQSERTYYLNYSIKNHIKYKLLPSVIKREFFTLSYSL